MAQTKLLDERKRYSVKFSNESGVVVCRNVLADNENHAKWVAAAIYPKVDIFDLSISATAEAIDGN